jgi:hydrogenase maturation protein HypF
MGRLFDAVSAMSGIRSAIDYEAQAAIEMEMKSCESADEKGTYPFTLAGDDTYHIVLLHDLISAVLNDLLRGCPQSTVGMRFHNTVAAMAAEVSSKIRESTGLNMVALSGGCFQNRLLLTKVMDRLESGGFKVLKHRQVPCNDGGISLGQAVIAGATA